MKKISILLTTLLLTVSLAACSLGAPRIVRTNGTSQTRAAELGDGIVATKGDATTTRPDPKTDSVSTKAQAVTIPGTTAALTTAAQGVTDPIPPVTTTGQETTVPGESTAPQTTSGSTTPSETKPAESTQTDGGTEIKSNLSPEFQQLLSEPGQGLLVIYAPSLYPEIKAITKWDISDYNTNTQLLLIVRDKGSRVEVTNSSLVDGGADVIPGDVIRDWETTSDFEAIRIVYSDPETMPFNFIRVRDPWGRVTTTPIQSSMRGNPDYETIPYDPAP